VLIEMPSFFQGRVIGATFFLFFLASSPIDAQTTSGGQIKMAPVPGVALPAQAGRQAAPEAPRPAADNARVLIEPAGETVLASSVAGRISRMATALGAPFSKGDVLVEMDCDEPRGRLGMARADLASATEQYEAKLRMQGLDQASDVEVALAASAVAKAKSQVEVFQFQTTQCQIKAPWAGRTTKLHVQTHMSVTPGQPMLDLVKAGVLRMKINVPSTWLAKIKSGNKLNVLVDETGKTYPAQVLRINGRVDPVSQTIEIEATMLREHADLLPGMSGVAKFPFAP
jgi:membrane fusion protein, multidrug efflux system